MLQCNVSKSGKVIDTFIAQTQIEIESWILNKKQFETWGKNERWIASNSPEFPNTDIQNAITKNVGTDPLTGQGLTNYLLPAEYTIEIIDISVQIETQKKINYSEDCLNTGAKIVAYIHYLNDQKNLDDQSFDAFLNNTTFDRIERLLFNGSLKKAHTMIESLKSIPTIYTLTEIDTVLSMIDDFNKKWGV